MFLNKNVFYREDLEVPHSNLRNIPISGYSILDMNNGRIGIENKESGARFYITDTNLMYLMKHGSFNNFEYDKECIVVKENQSFRLIPLNSPLYSELMEKDSSKNISLRAGKQYIVELNKIEKILIYLGKYKFREIYSKSCLDHFSGKFYSQGYVFLNEDNEIEITRRRDSFLLKEELGVIDSHKNKDYNVEYVKDIFFTKKFKNPTKYLISTGSVSEYSEKEIKKMRKFARKYMP